MKTAVIYELTDFVYDTNIVNALVRGIKVTQTIKFKILYYVSCTREFKQDVNTVCIVVCTVLDS